MDSLALSKPDSMEGKLVQIHSGEQPVQVLQSPAGEHEVKAHGKQGRVSYWEEESNSYYVETFDGMLLMVPKELVTEYHPESARDCGFNFLWPSGDSDEFVYLAFNVADSLSTNGSCAIQTLVGRNVRNAVVDFALEVSHYKRFKRQFEDAYLGFNPQSKVVFLQDEEGPQADSIEHIEQYLDTLHGLLEPMTKEAFSFVAAESRSVSLLRKECESFEEHLELDEGVVAHDDIEEGAVEQYLDFVQRRRVCFIFVVDGSGGCLELIPRDGFRELEPSSITLEGGRLVAFRHDLFNYSLSKLPASTVLLQTWMLEAPKSLMLEGIDGDSDFVDEFFGVIGRPLPVPGESSARPRHVTAMHCRFGASGTSVEHMASVFMSNVDGYIVLPQARFDIDLYYEEDGGMGKTRTKHSACLATEHLLSFDNEFFGLDYNLAEYLSPQTRMTIEVGYETLHNGGFRKKDLRGSRISYFLGHTSGMDSAHGHTASTFFNYLLDLTGRSGLIDTACSSALVALNMADEEIAKGLSSVALQQGVSALLDIGSYVAMSSGRMISSRGRSRTFDQTADGYGRGEGVASALLEAADFRKLDHYWMRLSATAINQDGKSASITAPSGPSQTEIIKGCLRSAGVNFDELDSTECHGTGTTLGDPIEVGSMQIAMVAGKPRQSGLAFTAAKTHIGHLELGAGLVGITKIALETQYGAIHPNNHLYQFNSHFALDGFPHMIPDELVSPGQPCMNTGVSSFGFGGTNSRADCWAAATKGPFGMLPPELTPSRNMRLDRLHFIHVPCPMCQGPMCHRCKVAVPQNEEILEKHRCSTIREEDASYEYCSNCYKGAYLFGGPHVEQGTAGRSVHIASSWSGWRSLEELTQTSTSTYQCAMRLGETLVERFYIIVDRKTELCIYPVVDKANQTRAIFGPNGNRNGRSWLIDGRDDDIPEGTLFVVEFTWTATSKQIRWNAIAENNIPPGIQGKTFQHTYSAVGSWVAMQHVDMMRSTSVPNAWEVMFTIGTMQQETFHFVRDHDDKQAIYPRVQDGELARDTSVQTAGPDDLGKGKYWVVTGKFGEAVNLMMQICNGRITVVTKCETEGVKSWGSAEGQLRHTYYAFGSWDNWGFREMTPDEEDPGVYRCQFTICDPELREEFQIVLDKDRKLTMYPAVPRSPPGEGLLVGPDAGGAYKNWEVRGPRGQQMEITLDLLSQDKRTVVTCLPVN